ncbi:hypothetical protein SD71_20685 [Cohnella kolymensis]|uniref:Electron transfer flavoprotein alpha subunit C-terminal domain-containing protein n=1 Tax=Cohnella kolymensis TaxID=1590652 RepID=A0ABR5A199_9BACL|nr:electron transfer flavoprotein subunit alpha/FixB family protein [Cohnella kolymensis]KIL34428.1 hypothetical protein SD71_20685 [Cohnella kolymensis]
MRKVFCYVPVVDGTVLNEHAWGLMKIANKINTERLPLAGIVVHSGLEKEQWGELPFDEVYHVRLEAEQWKVADAHVQAFEHVHHEIGAAQGIYLFASNPLYHETAVRLSVRYGGAVITHAVDIHTPNSDAAASSFTVKREIYRGKAHEYVTFRSSNPTSHQFVTMSPAVLYGERMQGQPSVVREIHYDNPTAGKVRFVSESVIGWEELKITEARCVIGVGRGLSGAGSMADIVRLAELLNAPIGGSKVADELGLIPRDRRIGSSGSAIDADIYIAIGISGSSQHLEGIKGVKRVIAVNSDPSAPIFQRCDIGIVGKFQDVIPALVAAVQSESSVSAT